MDCLNCGAHYDSLDPSEECCLVCQKPFKKDHLVLETVDASKVPRLSLLAAAICLLLLLLPWFYYAKSFTSSPEQLQRRALFASWVDSYQKEKEQWDLQLQRLVEETNKQQAISPFYRTLVTIQALPTSLLLSFLDQGGFLQKGLAIVPIVEEGQIRLYISWEQPLFWGFLQRTYEVALESSNEGCSWTPVLFFSGKQLQELALAPVLLANWDDLWQQLLPWRSITKKFVLHLDESGLPEKGWLFDWSYLSWSQAS